MYGGKIETLHVILVDTLNKLMTFRIQKKQAYPQFILSLIHF